MYFAISVGIYDCSYEKAELILRRVMKTQGFYLVDNQLWKNLSAETFNRYASDGLSICNYLVGSSSDNKWSRIFPANGPYSQIQNLTFQLSEKVGNPIMIFLVDDSSGWGYELYQQGQYIDGFHTLPMTSPTLEAEDEMAEVENQSNSIFWHNQIFPSSTSIEDKINVKEYLLKNSGSLTPKQKETLERKLDLVLDSTPLPTSEQLKTFSNRDLRDAHTFEQFFSITPNQHIKLEKYIGRPSVIANIFGIQAEDIAPYITRISRQSTFGSMHEKMHSFFQYLNVEHGDAEYYSFTNNIKYLEQQGINVNDWHHLVFQR